MDVVYTYKHSYSREIEWSIKSLKNISHNKVYVIGDSPQVNGVLRINYDQHVWAISPSLDVASKLIQIANYQQLSDDFILMMDDVFFMRKMTIYNYYRGNLIDHINKRKYNDRYKKMLTTTYDYIKSKGYNTLDYSCHTPFIMNKYKLKEVIDELLPIFESKKEISVRNVYGNKYNVRAKFLPRDTKNPPRYTNFSILSTTEPSFNRKYGIGQYIRAKLR